ncbi:hypothetical protein FN846DRAFT_902337 [Sphaerosporella brunnea]|uniref:Uncharacterized protein n=1 Tax=Sphaerosporella brunnea TaxID=1250544 RepID=A0A5J5FA26_9PEZI|nr:hypothetical protein FN846DRAFT_902337 [Sphaerosporella brunnea]
MHHLDDSAIELIIAATPKSDFDAQDAKPGGDSPHASHRSFVELGCWYRRRGDVEHLPTAEPAPPSPVSTAAELHRPTAGSAQLDYLHKITDVTALCSAYNMRNEGFKNTEDISQDRREEAYDGVRRWRKTAEESVRLWLDRR